MSSTLRYRFNKKTLDDFDKVESKSDDKVSIDRKYQFIDRIWTIVGLIICGYCGYWFYRYMADLHELQLWFSHIREVEREISLRTEAGLYYSYYKQTIRARSISRAIHSLKHDNATEHLRTINILERFNVYQEVFLAIVYRVLVSRVSTITPMFFYVGACFGLAGVSVSILFLLSWYISSSWTSGLLTVVWLTVNIDDSTRVFFTVNLRENFAFPFFWMQVLIACRILSTSSQSLRLSDAMMYLCTSYLFAIMWQFNQYIFLIQSLSLYSLALLQLCDAIKISQLLVLQSIALILVYLSHFAAQSMIIGAPVLSFALVSIMTLRLFRDKSGGLPAIIIEATITFIATILVNMSIKWIFDIESDTHIMTFLKAKLGLANAISFESRLYLCHGAFAFIDVEFFTRTSHTAILPIYALFVLIVIIRIAASRWWWKTAAAVSPMIAFVTIQSVISGCIAIFILRFKYLWFPQMAVLSAFCIGETIQLISNRFGHYLKSISLVCISMILIAQYSSIYTAQMSNEREFHDPDTVALMQWIETNTPQNASFTGSMQLLAGVKCCTGRHLTNHPHFENKWLRDRTKRLYQIYARRSANDVYNILRAEGTDYIILEDSICLAASDGCRTPDLVDIDNGHLPDSDDGQRSAIGTTLVRSNVPRFCDQIRYQQPPYSTYFALVFTNPTFRVYRLL